MTERKTNEKFLEELKEKGYDGKIKPLEKYNGARTKINFICLIHNEIFSKSPTQVLTKKCGCSECVKESRSKSQDYKRKTHEQFILELKDADISNIKLLEEYKNAKTKIKCECLICGNIFYELSNDLLRGQGCAVCAKNKKLTHEEFINRLENNGAKIKVLSQYTNARTKVKCQCLKEGCGHVFYSVPFTLMQGVGCPKCAGTMKKTNEQFVEEIGMLNPNITILGEYKNNREKIECKCNLCNGVFFATPNHLLSYTSCPSCNKSYMERKVQLFLDNNNIKYTPQKRYEDLRGSKGGMLSYDFYLPKYNLLIECQGIQHKKSVKYFGGEERFKTQLDHDKRKRNYAKNNNINLLEIWYYDEQNIEQILGKELLGVKV